MIAKSFSQLAHCFLVFAKSMKVMTLKKAHFCSWTNVLTFSVLRLNLLYVPKNRSHTLVCQFISGLHANFLALFWYQTDVKFTLKNSIWSMILQFTVTFGCLRWVFYIHRFGKNKQRMRQSLEAFCNLQISKIALNERNARVFSRFCTNFVNDAKNKKFATTIYKS